MSYPTIENIASAISVLQEATKNDMRYFLVRIIKMKQNNRLGHFWVAETININTAILTGDMNVYVIKAKAFYKHFKQSAGDPVKFKLRREVERALYNCGEAKPTKYWKTL